MYDISSYTRYRIWSNVIVFLRYEDILVHVEQKMEWYVSNVRIFIDFLESNQVLT